MTSQVAPGFTAGSEFRVNQVTSGWEGDPLVVSLGTGFMVLYQAGVADYKTPIQAYGQRYDAAGYPVGDPIALGTQGQYPQLRSAVALEGDRVAILIEESSSSGNQRLKVLDASGAVVSDQVLNLTSNWVQLGSVGAGFVLVTDTSAQRYDAQGAPSGAPIAFRLPDGSRTLDSVSVTDGDNGSFFITWREYYDEYVWDEGDPEDPYDDYGHWESRSEDFRFRYGADGQKEDWTFTAPSIIEVLENGNVLTLSTTWTQSAELSFRSNIQASIYTPAKQLVTSFTVPNDTQYGHYARGVAELADGNFAITWVSLDSWFPKLQSRLGQDGSDDGIYARIFAADGTPLSAEFQVNSHTNMSQINSAIAPLDDGGFAITWQSFLQDGTSWGVYGKVFTAETTPNQPPVTLYDPLWSDEDSQFTLNVLANDRDPDGDPLTIIGAEIINGAKGKVTISADGKSILYDPEGKYNGLGEGDLEDVDIKYTVSDGKGGTAEEMAVLTLEGMNDAPSGSVAISGNPAQNEILTASHTLVDPEGLGAISYQWQRNGIDIAGATATTYKLTAADVGSRITVVASYTDGRYALEAVTSQQTAIVTEVNNPPALQLSSSSAIMPENNASGVKVADLIISDDGRGTNNASVAGADASSFEIRTGASGGKELWFIGSADYEGQRSYQVIVNLDDPAIGAAGTIEASRTFSLAITNVIENHSKTLTESDDTFLAPTEGRWSIDGGGGHDDITTLGLADVINGGDGNDVLRGGEGNDILRGEADADRLYGGDGADELHGGNGDDYLAGGSGDDALSGGAGHDTADYSATSLGVSVSASGRTVTGVEIGTDSLDSIEGLIGGSGADTFVLGLTNLNSIDGRSGTDAIQVKNASQVEVRALTDNLINPATATTDVRVKIDGNIITVDNIEQFSLEANAAANLSLSGNFAATALSGATFDLSGLATLNAADILDATGLASANRIHFRGHGGDDLFKSAITGANDTFDGGAGVDSVDYSSATQSVTVNLATGSATGAQIGTDQLITVENVTGGSGADSLVGSGAANILIGGLGADTLVGGLGADRFIINGTAEWAAGESVDGTAEASTHDTLVWNNVATTVGLDVRNIDVIELNGNINTAGESITSATIASADYDKNGVGGDLFVKVNGFGTISAKSSAGQRVTIDASEAMLANFISGGLGVEVIIGGAGTQNISGYGGADNLSGGLGADNFELWSASELTGDTINGGLEAGTIDRIRIYNSGNYDFRLATISNIDEVQVNYNSAVTVTLTDAMASTADGNGDNILGDIRFRQSGSSTAAMTVDASLLTATRQLDVDGVNMGGADVITGGAGSDRINGGLGNDLLTGGTGNDTLTAGGGNDKLLGGAGEDRLIGYFDSYKGDVEAYGGAENDIIEGAFFTIAEGGAGNDQLRVGGALLKQVTRLDGGDGIDSITIDTRAAYATGTVALDMTKVINFENIFLSPGADIALSNVNLGTGGTLAVKVDPAQSGAAHVGITVNGAAVTAGGLTLTGGWGDDRLIGGSGADLLIGGGGSNSLVGGAGADRFRVEGWQPAAGGVTRQIDVVEDFAVGVGGDVLDLEALLARTSHVAGTDPFATGYLRLIQEGGSALVQVDVDGFSQGGGWETVVILQNVDARTVDKANFHPSYDPKAPVQLPSTGGAVTFTPGNVFDSVAGGSGFDTVEVKVHESQVAAITVTPSADGSKLLLDLDGDGTTDLTMTGVEDLVINGRQVVLSGDLSRTGLAKDTIYFNGTSDADTFDAAGVTSLEHMEVSGLEGDDTLIAANGGDGLEGGAGNDSLDGGGGTDTAIFSGAWSDYAISSAGGVITVTDRRDGSPEGSDALRNIEQLRFSNGTFGIAQILNDAPVAANDVGQTVVEAGIAGAGTPSVSGNSLANDSDADEALGDVLTVEGARAGTLAAGGTLTALSGATLIKGTYGDLTISADGSYSYALDNRRAATDQLSAGQAASETFTYKVRDAHGATALAQIVIGVTGAADAAGVTINGTASNDIIGTAKAIAGQPLPTIYSDTLYGLAGNDQLDGGIGGDRMFGGAGNDIYTVNEAGDQVIEETSTGADATGLDAVNSWVTYTLSGFVENLTLVGTDAISGTGNALANKITGNAAANTLRGLGGNDVLDGKGGADIMYGGAGNDGYFVDHAEDAVSEQTVPGTDDGGLDTVTSTISYVLGAYLENLTLSGISAINGTGNSLGNKIIGNNYANIIYALGGNDVVSAGGGNDEVYGGDGNDNLSGGVGIDRVYGGAGNDIYTVDNLLDVISEETAPGSGLDAGGLETVNSSVAWALGAYFENLTLTGSAAIDGTGNALNNKISGNTGSNMLAGHDGNDSLLGNGGNDSLVGGAGNDSLNGGIGVDSMYGGAGNDSYVVDAAGDIVSEKKADGSDEGGLDLVTSTVTYAIDDFIENLTLSGTAIIDGTGNSLNNKVTGNNSANKLWAGGGNDTILANGGDDFLYGEAGNDSLSGGLGADWLEGGMGADTLLGGTGADRFKLGGPTGEADKVMDFNRSEGDKIVLSATDFGLAAGALDPSRFTTNLTGLASSASGTGQFIYNSKAKTLLWDEDGMGGKAAVVIGTLGNAHVPDAGDFLLI